MAINKSENLLFFNPEHDDCFTLFTPEAVHNTHGIILVTGYSIITAAVIVTNAALLVGLFKTNNTLTLAQRLFVLMSSMDLVIGLVFLPLQVYMIFMSERQDCSLIMVQAFVSMFFPFMSGLILLLIVFHRFFLVVNTQMTQKLAHRKNIHIFLSISAFFSAAMSTWYVFQKRSPNYTYHGIYYLTAGIITTGYLLIVTLVNVRLVFFLKAAAKTGVARASVSNNRKSYHQRVSKTLILMSIVVTVCYLPMAFSFVTSGIFLLYEQHHMEIIQVIIPWSQMIMTLNSALNSYIYIVRTRSMSKFYKKLFEKYCCGGRTIGSNRKMFHLNVDNTNVKIEKSDFGSAKF